jgi:Fic-DOC domain mobile mystery protein B
VPLFPPIPGETPIDDASGLKVKGVVNRTQLNAVEAENIRKAVVKYLAARPSPKKARFDYAWLLRLHKEMFGDVWDWAGKLRTCNLNIGVAPAAVEQSLYTMIENLRHRRTLKGFDVFSAAVDLHYQSVRIHPFLNGNGRWSRLLSNIFLKQNDHPIVVWPEEAVGSESPIRGEYIAAIKAADDYDMSALMELHRRYLEP